MSLPVSTQRRGRKSKKYSSGSARTMTPGTDLLAVTGWIYACPYSTIVLDFSCPFQPQPPERWLDLRHVVDPDDTRFDDIEFVRWDNDGLLLRGCDTEDDRWKEVRVSMEQLKAEML